MKDQNGNLFFAANDTRPIDSNRRPCPPSSCARSSTRAGLKGGRLPDCCYGGRSRAAWFPRPRRSRCRRGLAGLAPGPERGVITASSAIEYAFEGDRLADSRAEPSVFATAMRDGIATGTPTGTATDGRLHELFDFVRTRIQRLGKPQTRISGTSAPAGTEAHSQSCGTSGVISVATSGDSRTAGSPLPVVRLGAIADLEQRAGDVDLAEARGAVAALIELADDDSLRVPCGRRRGSRGVTLGSNRHGWFSTAPSDQRGPAGRSGGCRDAYPSRRRGGNRRRRRRRGRRAGGPHVDAGTVRSPCAGPVDGVGYPSLWRQAKSRHRPPAPPRRRRRQPRLQFRRARLPSNLPRPPRTPARSSSQPTLRLPGWRSGRRDCGSSRGALCLVSLLVPLYPYDGAENAFYEFPPSPCGLPLRVSPRSSSGYFEAPARAGRRRLGGLRAGGAARDLGRAPGRLRPLGRLQLVARERVRPPHSRRRHRVRRPSRRLAAALASPFHRLTRSGLRNLPV